MGQGKTATPWLARARQGPQPPSCHAIAPPARSTPQIDCTSLECFNLHLDAPGAAAKACSSCLGGSTVCSALACGSVRLPSVMPMNHGVIVRTLKRAGIRYQTQYVRIAKQRRFCSCSELRRYVPFLIIHGSCCDVLAPPPPLPSHLLLTYLRSYTLPSYRPCAAYLPSMPRVVGQGLWPPRQEKKGTCISVHVKPLLAPDLSCLARTGTHHAAPCPPDVWVSWLAHGLLLLCAGASDRCIMRLGR